MLTMLIGGLWHGAAWNFVIWGGIHGLLLIAERLIKQLLGSVLQINGMRLINAIFGWFITLLLVMFAWVWFRVDDLEQGIAWSAKLINIVELLHNAKLVFTEHSLVIICFVILLAIQLIFRNVLLEKIIDKTPLPILALILGLLAVLIIISPGDSNAFIYFQF